MHFSKPILIQLALKFALKQWLTWKFLSTHPNKDFGYFSIHFICIWRNFHSSEWHFYPSGMGGRWFFLPLLRMQLTISQHWFRSWLVTNQVTSHCLNQCWFNSLIHTCMGPDCCLSMLYLSPKERFGMLGWQFCHQWQQWSCHLD